MAMSNADYQKVVAINDEMRDLEGRFADALRTADDCKRKLAALESAREAFVKAASAVEATR